MKLYIYNKMNYKYILPLGCAFSGGLIYRYYNNLYINEFRPNSKYNALIRYEYDANIFNLGMIYGFSIGLTYIVFKNLAFPLYKINTEFS